MAVVTPQTDLYLLKCPLEIDQQNQLTFSNATAQYNYFNSLPKRGNTDFTYQRKDGVIRFNADIEDIRGYNYCMYRNDAYSNKWFYAFIDDMKYANDGVTFITLKTDVWQTWYFELTFKPCFVEREHVNNDSIGAHTIDEGLDYGEPIINATQGYLVANNANESQRIVAQVTELPIDNSTNQPIIPPGSAKNRTYNGIPQGTYFCVFSGYNNADNFTRWYDVKGKKDAIVALFLVPASMVTNATYTTYTIADNIGGTIIGFLPSSFSPHTFAEPTLTYSSTLNGYTPKNKKLYCYPYSYLVASNNTGSSVIYHYEDFQNPTTPKFNVKGTLGQGCAIRMYPYEYKANHIGDQTYDYGISCSKLPLLSWQSDYYLNWQAQNGVNNAVQGGIGVFNALGQIAGGLTAAANEGGGAGVSSIMGGAANLAGSIASTMQSQHLAELVPAQALGNTNCADLNYALGKCGFTFQKMSCRYEYAQMIDNYFSMFGYKVNSLKVPNITGRSNWNYVKTRICNVIGDVPQEDIDEIKAMFNNGITLWHKTGYFMDYSQTNSIV